MNISNLFKIIKNLINKLMVCHIDEVFRLRIYYFRLISLEKLQDFHLIFLEQVLYVD